MCFIVKHARFWGKICPTYQQFCIASAFFFAKMLVLLNKFTTFAMCFIVKHARKGSQLKTFATMTMTLNIYKDEYKASHLDYLRKAFTVESETSKVVTISGTQADLERAMMGMYNNDEQFKSLFPAFITEQERIENTKNEMKHLADEMRDTLLRIINYGVIGNDFMELRELYFAKFQKL